MVTTTMQQKRAWQGPALFSYGFRPFFLFASAHAALMIAIWIPWYLGYLDLPSALPPVAWHEHELLFGYVPAIVAGFLLTAVPNWTGRLPVVGRPLVLLFSLWCAGRIAIAFSGVIGLLPSALIALAFLPVLALVILRELLAGKNHRNIKVLAVLIALTAAHLLFFYEVQQTGTAIFGSRLAIAAAVMLIMIIAGRIVPSFTANWIKRVNPGREPVPFGSFDIWSMAAALLALLGWVFSAVYDAIAMPAGFVLIAAGILQSMRQFRWRPHRTVREPLVLILHVAFFFVPLGFILSGSALLLDQPAWATAGIHSWTTGAIGAMTLAVMTRASRGHTGQALTAPPSTVIIYAMIVIAATARITAALAPAQMTLLLSLAATAWVAAYVSFAIIYGPLLVRK